MNPTQQQPATPPQMPPQMPPPQGNEMPPQGGGNEMPPQPQQPQAGVNSGPISPQEKQALLDMITQVRAKMDSLKATRFAANNKVDILRKQILQQVFEKLQMAGVDLSSQESVSQFIQNLQQKNPELAMMFEKSMNILLGGAPQPAAAPGMDQNMNNQNPNEAVPQNV